MLVDTHCHLHDSEFYPEDREAVYTQSVAAGVAMVCVGTSVRSSREAVEFCATHPLTWPVVGIHPHESSSDDVAQIAALLAVATPSLGVQPPTSIIGIGEIGLDYYYTHSPKSAQIAALGAQLQLAVDYNLPVSFHVRDAFDDFWSICDNFHNLRGVLHSFTDTKTNLDKGLTRGFYVGVNGISTFTKDTAQRQLLTSVPLERLVLETDAPFLTPVPFRGKMNIPAYVGSVAEFQAHTRGMPLDTLCNATTANAAKLFGVDFTSEYTRSLPNAQHQRTDR